MVLVAAGFGDDGQVGFDCFGVAVAAEVATPAGWFGLDVVDEQWLGAAGFFGDEAGFGDGQGVGQEGGRGFAVAVWAASSRLIWSSSRAR